MENGQNTNEIGAHVDIIVKSRSRTDIMARRLKNRERQRRYRARKRLEADMIKSPLGNQPTMQQVQLQLTNGNSENCITRVHCNRNWKKDARRVHAFKNLEEAPGTVVISDLNLNSGNQSLNSGVVLEASLERKNYSDNSFSLVDGETKAKRGKRDWKAEARRKKN